VFRCITSCRLVFSWSSFHVYLDTVVTRSSGTLPREAMGIAGAKGLVVYVQYSEYVL
jgi:hypothetical protein